MVLDFQYVCEKLCTNSNVFVLICKMIKSQLCKKKKNRVGPSQVGEKGCSLFKGSFIN
jgi:hypothetical protein